MSHHLSDQQLESIMAQERAGVPPLKIKVPAAAPRKSRNNEESRMQRALVRWFDFNAHALGVHPLCLMSIPNGGNGDARRGSIMKAEGQRRGAPDLFLSAPRKYLFPAGLGCSPDEQRVSCVCGLFLELKTARGRLAPEQEVYHELLRKQGYRVEVVRELQQGINVITTYLTA